jgi:hypothetical protein
VVPLLQESTVAEPDANNTIAARKSSEGRSVSAGRRKRSQDRSLITLWQTPGKQHAAAAGHNILPVIEFVGDRRTRDLAAGAGVPESFAIAGIERKNVAVGVAGERDA